MSEQRTFTAGRIVVHGSKATRCPAKRADYLLRYPRDYLLAVVDAKPTHKKAPNGLQHAKEYAEVLKLKFAYLTNENGIVEFDLTTGKETELSGFSCAEELWKRVGETEKLKDDSAAEGLLLYAA
jgi:type I restriction enzyme, R subunit